MTFVPHSQSIRQGRKGQCQRPAGSVEPDYRYLDETDLDLSDKAREWVIDEIEFGLTLSAKGELLFIAEAGAEASIKFTLKKKDGAASDEAA